MLALACTGCALHVHRDPEPQPGFSYEPNAALAPFETFERTAVVLSEPFEETRTHDIVRITFGSSGRNGHPENLVEGQYFRSKEPGAKALVVVMPIHPPRFRLDMHAAPGTMHTSSGSMATRRCFRGES